MKKRGIKFKIVVSVVLVVTICLGIMGVAAYQYLQNMLMEDAMEEAEKKVNDITVQLETIEEQMNTIADYIITDQSVIEYLTRKEEETIKDKNDAVYEMSHILTRFVVINDYINNIYMKRSDGWIYSNNRELDNRYLDPYLAGILRQENTEDDNKFFTDLHKTPAYTESKSGQTISFIVRFSVLGKSDFEEYLILGLDYDRLKQIVEQGSTDLAYVGLYNHKGQLVYTEGEEIDDSDKDIIFIEKETDNGNWKATVAISRETLFSKIENVLAWFLFIIVALAVVLIVVLVQATSKITRPIEELSQAMQKVGKGQYDTQVIVRSNDEIEELADVFNGMTRKIYEYIEESIQYEQTKRELQLDLLMNQINPHFIYNTLNSIIYCAHSNRLVGVEEITRALIHILQDSVKIGKHAIKDYVSVEVDIVKNYMKIQEYRYPKRFAFTFSCPEALYDMEIPKMIIQPLIENALFHGVCLREEVGRIDAKLYQKVIQERTWIEIVVKDSGVGMSKEKIANCFTEDEAEVKSNKTRSIGLNNIKKRLEFLYKENYYIRVWSKEGLGTVIVIGFLEG